MTQEQIQVIRDFIMASDSLSWAVAPRSTPSERREALEIWLSARRKLGNTWNTELWQRRSAPPCTDLA